MNKKTLKRLIIVMIIGVVTLLCINSREIVNFTSTFNNARMTGNTDELLSYIVYDNQDSAKIKILVNINANDIIEYVVRPDGEIINGNGKQELFLDYTIEVDKDEIFKIKIVEKEEIEKTINVSEELCNSYINIQADNIKKYFDVFYVGIGETFKMNNSDVIYYKVGENSTRWLQPGKSVKVAKDDLQFENANDKVGKAKLYFKRTDKSGNIVYSIKDIVIDTEAYEVEDKPVKLLDYAIITSTGIYNAVSMDGQNDYYLKKDVVLTPKDAVQINAYDGDENTYFQQIINMDGAGVYIDVDESARGKTLRYIGHAISNYYAYGGITAINDNEERTLLLGTSTGVGRSVYLVIPDDCIKIEFGMQGNYVIYEISVE